MKKMFLAVLFLCFSSFLFADELNLNSVNNRVLKLEVGLSDSDKINSMYIDKFEKQIKALSRTVGEQKIELKKTRVQIANIVKMLNKKIDNNIKKTDYQFDLQNGRQDLNDMKLCQYNEYDNVNRGADTLKFILCTAFAVWGYNQNSTYGNITGVYFTVKAGACLFRVSFY